MNSRGLILGVLGLLVLLLLLFLALRSQRTLEAGLPERIVCASQGEAQARAGIKAFPVLGTGSMAPYIPAAPAGADPLKTIVAYAVRSDSRYEAIAPGALVVYRPCWANPTGLVIHGAAQKDASGWIMSGLHNAQSESWARVTPANFIGIVKTVYVWTP